ncbi:helicase-associated domain-containing protein [Cohnella nanjingensis]|uniref:Helicase-associated domain-containing protein n=1 Tax=Cohnella nanjingensis TaxID=1387779 RepID=A0A7X0RP94_9BACL|nr:helicase-associated domain-containing protein [Cohnella nanjingensis]MBB6671144.1 helicase-associated domain-containing protein [Cohnella nanjingensis]
MNTEEIAERMPPGLREWLGENASLAERIGNGRPWAAVLGAPDRAAEWAAGCEPPARETMMLIVRRFAGLPFEEDKLLQAAAEEGRWTGAETRVAMQRLRADGILFAVRKAWGDRLFYLPSDMVGVWQRLLLPTHSEPVAPEREADIAARSSDYRLPLSLELLHAWSAVRRYGLPLTAKGAPHKAAIAKIAAAIRLEGAALAALGFAAVGGDPTPPQMALALDLGLHAGVLERGKAEIRVKPDGAARWLEGTAAAIEAKLASIVTLRYAGQDPALHYAATAVGMVVPGVWYREADVAAAKPGSPASQAIGTWLEVLAAFAWVDRGTLDGREVFRWMIDPDPERAARAAPLPDGLERYEVLPDLEIVVPPEVPPGARWALEEIAERASSDVVSLYRLSRSACERASRQGHTPASVAALLEAGSGAPLPEAASAALDDWFRRLGRVEIAETALLRVDEPGLADQIGADAEAAALLAERIGDRYFVVREGARKALEARLAALGYPPSPPRSGPADPGGDDAAETAAVDAGWAYRRQILSFYELDPTPPASPDELFPGLNDVPATWLRQPRAYHASTIRELVERALHWGTALRVRRKTGEEGPEWITFVPQAVSGSSEGWQVSGLVRGAADRDASDRPPAASRATLAADGIGELMIVLPEAEPRLRTID